MGDFRIKYGSAFGPVNNFYVTSANVLTSGDTTPDVTAGTLWYTANTSTTTVTHFDLTAWPDTASNAGAFEGKHIILFFTDSNTTLTYGGRLFLSGSASTTFPANSVLELVYHNSGWYEISRSYNRPTTQQLETNGTERNISISMAGCSNTITVSPLYSNYFLTATDAKAELVAICGGYVGQMINLLNNGTSGTTIKIVANATGNIIVVATGSIMMYNSAFYSFVKQNATTWVTTPNYEQA